MIQTIITHHCSKCMSINLVKNGKGYKGCQKYHCHDCAAYGTLEPQSRAYSQEKRATIPRAYRERASMRGVERIFKVVLQTLAHWLCQEAEQLPELAETLEPAMPDDVLESDELSAIPAAKSRECGFNPRRSPYTGFSNLETM